MRVLLFLLISTSAHFLALRWVRSVSPWARARPRFVFGTAAGMSSLLGVLRLIGWAFPHSRFIHDAIAFGLIELFIVVVSLPFLYVVAATTRLATRTLARSQPPEPERISRREAIERVVGASAVGATSVAFGWGILRGRHSFALEEVVVKVAGWPRALDGYVIAQVSDIHVGSFVGDRELDEGFELVRRVKPDLLVATGDLVDLDADAIGPLLTRLHGAGARDGAYAILGNHDHYAGAADVAALVSASKVRLLDNEGVRVRPNDGGGFALLGVDDLQGRRSYGRGRRGGPDLGRAIAGLPPDLPRILLAHQPAYFTESQGRVGLQLSGHTHGGQINPGFTPLATFMEFVAGRYERAGSTLWVNRGFGVSGPPTRIGAPPEVTKLVIVSG